MNRDEILGLIERVAQALGDELDRIVFVGGAVASLYDGHVDIRPTEDVDCATAVTRTEYFELTERLRQRGFEHVMEPGAPVCRFRLKEGVLVDIMPTDAGILGFTNRWYAEALDHAERFQLPSGAVVRAISPLYFLATKLEAFRDRGNNDFAMSHDLEDIVALLVARPDLLDAIEQAANDVTRAIRTELATLAANDDFLDTLPFYFPGDAQRAEKAEPFTRRLMNLRDAAKPHARQQPR